MAEFIKENPINGKWKLMTFFPIRESALKNKEKLIKSGGDYIGFSFYLTNFSYFSHNAKNKNRNT